MYSPAHQDFGETICLPDIVLKRFKIANGGGNRCRDYQDAYAVLLDAFRLLSDEEREEVATT